VAFALTSCDLYLRRKQDPAKIMSRSKLTGILAILVAFLIALVAGIALYTSIRYVEAEAEARATIQSSNAYSHALDQLKDAMLDAETGQRGYLLTGNRDYLQPYLEVRESIEPETFSDWALAALRNGEDTELNQLIEFKLTALDETLRLFDTGNPNAALSMIQTDRGQELMRDIRAAISVRQDEANIVAEEAAAQISAYGQRSDLVSSLLAALLALATIMGGVTVYLWTRTDQALAEAEVATDEAERIEVIAKELNHRMKNMFAVAQGMLRQSARGRGDDVEAYADEATARITAMSHAYSITRDLDAAATMSTDDVIDRVVRAQLLGGHRFDLQGDSWPVQETAITPLALILHEWTTNTLKYGAWRYDGDDAARAGVTIIVHEGEGDNACLVWDETCDRAGQDAPQSSGYGAKLVKACASQLGGKVEYEWHGGGVRITLSVDKNRL